jgi:hypothetical protein
MTREEQRTLLRNFTQQVTDHLLSQSERWPAEWDGHELRELVSLAFEFERTSLMRESRARRKACHNTIIVEDLY